MAHRLSKNNPFKLISSQFTGLENVETPGSTNRRLESSTLHPVEESQVRRKGVLGYRIILKPKRVRPNKGDREETAMVMVMAICLPQTQQGRVLRRLCRPINYTKSFRIAN
jgi:hypothetical protein